MIKVKILNRDILGDHLGGLNLNTKTLKAENFLQLEAGEMR